MYGQLEVNTVADRKPVKFTQHRCDVIELFDLAYNVWSIARYDM